jgi:DNA-binding CsgD family transcriptional regulator
MARLLLRHLVIGVLVTSADGDIVCSNGAADEILRSADGLFVEDGRLSAMRAVDRRRLVGFMREVAEARDEQPVDRVLLISRTSFRSPYSLFITAVSGEALGGPGQSARFALVMISDPDRRVDVTAARVRDIFGLSQAEARLAVALLWGKRISEVAQEAQLRVPTLRAQLRSILQKTGARSQSDFIRLALALAPVLDGN